MHFGRGIVLLSRLDLTRRLTRGLVEVLQPLFWLTHPPIAVRKQSEEIWHIQKRPCGAVGRQAFRKPNFAWLSKGIFIFPKIFLRERVDAPLGPFFRYPSNATANLEITV